MNYIVQANDNLLSIADKFKVSISELIKENNLDYIYKLVPGLELIIPINEENNDNNNYQEQDTNNNTENYDNYENIDDSNNEENMNTTSNLFSYYIVEKGDNLYQIGKRYNISPQVLADLNGLNIDDFIYPDQQIMVPRDGVGLYITKDGDTIESMARDLNILPEDILISNENLYLLPNQLISYKTVKLEENS